MRHIQKNEKEPISLKLYRETTQGATWKGFIDKHNELKKYILKEQGYLCAYCMKKIDIGKMSVEHYKSRKHFPQFQLDYSNMIGVCEGCIPPEDVQKYIEPEAIKSYKEYKNNLKLQLNISIFEQYEENQHCDKSKKSNEFLSLDIREEDCESKIFFTKEGEIKPKENDLNLEFDLNCILNLNHPTIKEYRKNIIDQVINNLIREKPDKQWNQSFFDKHIEKWKQKVGEKYKAYYFIAVLFLKEMSSKRKYSRD